MADYVIHACPQRMWYVDGFLIPSLENQGIENITVECDTEGLGNLEKCMQIFSKMSGYDSTWHIQDDVIICHDFKKRIERFEPNQVVCGFCIKGDENYRYKNKVKPQNMWWSFPCIHIPNKLAHDCAEWYYGSAKNDAKYKRWVSENKYDDALFKDFSINLRPSTTVINLTPNLVDHIDFLVGGTTVNQERKWQTRSAWFQDLQLIDELEQRIKEYQSERDR